MTSLSGLPLAASPRSPLLNGGGDSTVAGEDSLPIEVENGALAYTVLPATPRVRGKSRRRKRKE